MVEQARVQRGLEEVVALESRICFIDGKLGRLIYRGYDIRDLAAYATFEEVAHLLWYGRLPNARELSDLRNRLGALRTLPEPLVRLIDTLPAEAPPMDLLRTAVSALALYELEETKPGATAIAGAERLTAALPTILGQFHRRRRGLPKIRPRPELSPAAYVLYALLDREASELEERALDVALILHADHELNASTFAARVTASTLSDLYSSVTSAIGALKGPLHGGANERAIELVELIGTPDRTEAIVKEKLSRHERIMGFGHRVYKVEDPRATILREWSRKIGEAKGDLHYYQILEREKEIVHQEKGLFPNLDLYSGSVYTLLGIPNDLFTPIFAVSRVSGWTAHILEEYEDLRLIRPTAQYIGPTDLPWIPLADRH
jgi:citrate synthase